MTLLIISFTLLLVAIGIAFQLGYEHAARVHASLEQSYQDLIAAQREYIAALEKSVSLHRKILQEVNDTVNEPQPKGTLQ